MHRHAHECMYACMHMCTCMTAWMYGVHLHTCVYVWIYVHFMLTHVLGLLLTCLLNVLSLCLWNVLWNWSATNEMSGVCQWSCIVLHCTALDCAIWWWMGKASNTSFSSHKHTGAPFPQGNMKTGEQPKQESKLLNPQWHSLIKVLEVHKLLTQLLSGMSS